MFKDGFLGRSFPFDQRGVPWKLSCGLWVLFGGLNWLQFNRADVEVWYPYSLHSHSSDHIKCITHERKVRFEHKARELILVVQSR